MLAQLLGPNFLSENYSRSPYASPGIAQSLASLLTWEKFGALLPRIPEEDILVVKEARLFHHIPRDREAYENLHRSGHSLVLRHTERFDPELAKIASDLGEELKAGVVIQIYSTPCGGQSFGWHYDVEEVFIVQTEGEKKYFLRENTVNPRPRLPLPKDMQYEKETSSTLGTQLVPGDFLYIPSGWWHVAKAVSDSLSLSVGVLQKGTSSGT